MARKVEEIQEEILQAKENQAELIGLNSTSKTAIWRLWVYIIAFAIWSLEVIFDAYDLEINTKLTQLKPHTLRWYRNKALAFQYGFDLLIDSDKYDNTNATDDTIQNSKIIKYAAVTEAMDESRLILKIAAAQNGTLSPVTATQYDAFKTYISEIKDAGVPVSIINYLPDRLRLQMRIVRDALVLDINGMNRDTGTMPVNLAIQEFLKVLPFDGALSIQKLEAKILAVPGVKDLSIDLAESSWIGNDGTSYGDWLPIDIVKIPNAGYFTVNLTEENDSKSNITYV